MLKNFKNIWGLPRLIVVFGIALSLPLVYLALRTYQGLENEEAATLSYFAETLFDEIEASLAEVIRREEGRAIDAYDPGAGAASLSRLPAEPFIRGYFQNNPDGSFQTPLAEEARSRRPELAGRMRELEEANRVFNRKRADKTDQPREEPAKPAKDEKKKETASFAGKYLDPSVFQRNAETRSARGERDSRQADVTAKQAQSMAKAGPPPVRAPAPVEQSLEKAPAAARPAPSPPPGDETPRVAASPSPAAAPPPATVVVESQARETNGYANNAPEARVQVEIAPLQSVFIDDGRVFIFRRILINGQIYRQGFILQVDAFLAHLTQTYFSPQPMARFTRLRLQAVDQGHTARSLDAGAAVRDSRVELNRTFSQPFTFFRAALVCENIPPSAGRTTLNIALAALAGIFLMGVGAIYFSARKIVDFSERQSRFVSSVTHELKTPLTNIRMYIEMLEQGMARDPEREQEYFRILGSEGARLSRLITNVLELSKLEKQHRRPDLKPGDFGEVLAEVENLMAEPLKLGGFKLKLENRLSQPFRYDREIMVQVLINLIENSVKFGKSAEVREIAVGLKACGRRVDIEVSDTGPGIPNADLKKIFNDFYRSKDAAARAAGGTGIGLALVRRFVALVGGEVSATNNEGPGCTFTIRLPA